MKKKFSFLLQNIGILTVSSFASKILVFLLVPLYTSVLSTTDVGVYDLVVSAASIFFPILSYNISDAVMRFSLDPNHSRDSVAFIGIRYVLRNAILVTCIILLVRIAGLWQGMRDLEWLLILYYFFNSFHQLFVQMAKGHARVKDMGIAGILGTVIMISSNILFLVVIRLGLRGFFLANILAQAVPTIYLFFRLKIGGIIFRSINNNISIEQNLEKEMRLYSIPLIVTTIGWWINSTSDKYVVALFCGVSATGLLSVAYKIPSIISVFQGIFTQAWQISAVKEYGDQSTQSFYSTTFCFMNVGISAVCAWLIIGSRWIAHVLYAKSFYIAYQYVPFLLISCVINSASGFLGPILSAKKDSKTMALSSLYGAVVNTILNVILVILIGIQGATIATVISSCIIFYFRRRALLDEFQIDGIKCVLLTWILLCVEAIFEIYTSYWIVEVLLLLIMLFINRSSILKLITICHEYIKGRR